MSDPYFGEQTIPTPHHMAERALLPNIHQNPDSDYDDHDGDDEDSCDEDYNVDNDDEDDDDDDYEL